MSESNGTGTALATLETLESNTMGAVSNYVATRDQGGEIDEIAKLVAESTEEVQLSIDRLTIKATGFFTRDADGVEREVSKEIIGVVMMVTKPRSAFLANDHDYPICQSMDGKVGIVFEEAWQDEDIREAVEDADIPHPILADTGRRVFNCATCTYNNWRLVPRGSGLPCTEKRLLWTVLDDAKMITLVNVPVTSIRRWDHYEKECGKHSHAFFMVRTKLTTEPKSEGKNTWGLLAVVKEGPLDEDAARNLEKARSILPMQKAARTMFMKRIEMALAEAEEREAAADTVTVDA